MQKVVIALLVVVAAASTPCVNGAPTPSSTEELQANKAVIQALMQGFNAMDLAVVDKYMAHNIIQHFPGVADGIEAYKEHLRQEFAAVAEKGGPKIQILQLGADGPFVYLHSKRFNRAGNPLSVMQVFRMQDAKVLEQWKVIAELTPELVATAANSHSLF